MAQQRTYLDLTLSDEGTSNARPAAKRKRSSVGTSSSGSEHWHPAVRAQVAGARLELPCRPGGSLAGSDLRCGQALHDLDWWPYACGRPQGGGKAAVNSCVDAMLPRFAASARSAIPTTIDAVLRTAVTHDPGCINVKDH